MNKCFVLVLTMFVVSDAFSISDIIDWIAYKGKYEKHYNSIKDELNHFRIFIDNKHKINEHNQQSADGNGITTFRMGYNKYSDMKNKDFVSQMNGHDNKNKFVEISIDI